MGIEREGFYMHLCIETDGLELIEVSRMSEWERSELFGRLK